MIHWAVYLAPVLPYSVQILRYTYGWCKTANTKTLPNDKTCCPTISVVVAFRNEEKNLENLLTSLCDQNYPTHSFEVILINDHSTDGSLYKIAPFLHAGVNMKLLHTPISLSGKKASLSYALQHVNSELVVFTDADCWVGENWLRSFCNAYKQFNEPDMLLGLVDMFPAIKFSEKTARLDYLSLTISAYGAAYFNKPVFNSGANLCVKRKSFDFEQDFRAGLASGDDVFLLHALKKKKGKIKAVKDTDNLVYSLPPATWSSFFRQRWRWASKASKYTDKDSKQLSWLIFLSNLYILFVFAFSPYLGFFAALAVYTCKTLTDFLVFLSAKDYFKFGQGLFLIPFIEILYPFYIVGIAILSKKRPFRWKGRIHILQLFF